MALYNIYMLLPVNNQNVIITNILGSTRYNVINILTSYRYLTTEHTPRLESNALDGGNGECWNM